MWQALIAPVLGIIDKVIPDPKAKAEAQFKAMELAQKGELTELQEAASIVRAEAQGEGALQRNWRPIVMLTFTGLIVCRWLGLEFSPQQIPLELEVTLFEIVKLGLGGYVIGRSVEKATKAWKEKD